MLKNKTCKLHVFENVKMYASIYMYAKPFDINFLKKKKIEPVEFPCSITHCGPVLTRIKRVMSP